MQPPERREEKGRESLLCSLIWIARSLAALFRTSGASSPPPARSDPIETRAARPPWRRRPLSRFPNLNAVPANRYSAVRTQHTSTNSKSEIRRVNEFKKSVRGGGRDGHSHVTLV